MFDWLKTWRLRRRQRKIEAQLIVLPEAKCEGLRAETARLQFEKAERTQQQRRAMARKQFDALVLHERIEWHPLQLSDAEVAEIYNRDQA